MSDRGRTWVMRGIEREGKRDGERIYNVVVCIEVDESILFVCLVRVLRRSLLHKVIWARGKVYLNSSYTLFTTLIISQEEKKHDPQLQISAHAITKSFLTLMTISSKWHRLETGTLPCSSETSICFKLYMKTKYILLSTQSNE